MIKPCKKCGSEDMVIAGSAWIQIQCNDCMYTTEGHSYGSRVYRYNKAIEEWNGVENENQNETN